MNRHRIRRSTGWRANIHVDERMKKLADHIRLAGKDVEEIHVSSRKISQRFEQIESVQLEDKPAAPNVVRLADEC